MARPKGIPHSEEFKKRISDKLKGRMPKNIDLFKAKAFSAMRGKIPWNKGLTKNNDERMRKASENMREVIPEIRVCEICKNEFEWTKHKPKKRCSKKCDSIWRRIRGIIPQNAFKKGHIPHNYKGGITKDYELIRGSSEYKKWRWTIFIRDHFTCLHCGQVGGQLEVHHIKRFSEYSELRLDINNGITLCKECHTKTDSYKNRKVK